MSTTTRLDRAIEHLSAEALASGEYAHYDDGTRKWHIVDADDLESLCDYLDSEDADIRADAYSHWCAGTASRASTAAEMKEIES
jgi:hypothetical protein